MNELTAALLDLLLEVEARRPTLGSTADVLSALILDLVDQEITASTRADNLVIVR